MNNRLAFSILFLTIPVLLSGQEKKPELVFELPVIDLPYQIDAAKTVNNGDLTFGSFFKGYANPSMLLSMNLSADLYTGLHYGIARLFNPDQKLDWRTSKRFWYIATLIGSDFVLEYFPGFDGWEHEEYHRAVLSRFHVNSFNDMNKFPIGKELVNVSHLTDEDLSRFKLESPADFIRSQVSGIEGEYLLVDRLQRNNFYYNQKLPHEVLYLYATINSIAYVQTCSNPEEADKLTDQANSEETTIPVRDFAGLDFLGWTYDLFRPDEPYEARGIHPSGTGIDRYIKTTDLTPEELSYLKHQGKLQLLNAVSPMLIGIKRLKISDKGVYANFSLHHYLTSFGNDISGNIFLKYKNYNLFLAYHSYRNYNRSFPALELQMIDYYPVANKWFSVSPRIIVGLQPLDQVFKTGKASFLGLAECKVEFKSGSYFNPYIELSAKTEGWIAGNEFLDENLSCRIGIISRISLKNKKQD